MSVKSHRFEGDRIIVSLRGGGEMTFDRSVVLKIAPDEVPYPEETQAAAVDVIVPEATGVLIGKTVYDPLIESASDQQRRARATRESAHPGGIGVSAARAIAQGRDGADAVDAGDGPPVSGP